MPFGVDDPCLETRLGTIATGTSRQKSIVTEIERNFRHLSNSNAKHLHVGFLKGPKPRHGGGPSGRRKLNEFLRLDGGHDVRQPIRRRCDRSVCDIDAHLAPIRNGNDRHLGGVGTAEFKLVLAGREARLSKLRTFEAPLSGGCRAPRHLRKRPAQSRARGE